MTFVYWFIIAGLVWNCVYLSRALSAQKRASSEWKKTAENWEKAHDLILDSFDTLKAKIVTKAGPEVVNKIPKRFSGPQLRVLNDRLNAQATKDLQERPNSEILNEVANG